MRAARLWLAVLVLGASVVAAAPCRPTAGGECVCEGSGTCECETASRCVCRNAGDCLCGNASSCTCANERNCYCGTAFSCKIQNTRYAFCAKDAVVGTSRCDNFGVTSKPYCVARPFDNVTAGIIKYEVIHSSSDNIVIDEGYTEMGPHDIEEMDTACKVTVMPAIAFAIFVMLYIVYVVLLYACLQRCSYNEYIGRASSTPPKAVSMPSLSLTSRCLPSPFQIVWMFAVVPPLVPIYLLGPGPQQWPFMFMFIPIVFVLMPCTCWGRSEFLFDAEQGEARKIVYYCCGAFSRLRHYVPLESIDHAETSDREHEGSGGTWTETVVTIHTRDGRKIDVTELIRDGMRLPDPQTRAGAINLFMQQYRAALARAPSTSALTVGGQDGSSGDGQKKSEKKTKDRKESKRKQASSSSSSDGGR